MLERELQGVEKSAMAMSVELTQDACTLDPKKTGVQTRSWTLVAGEEQIKTGIEACDGHMKDRIFRAGVADACHLHAYLVIAS